MQENTQPISKGKFTFQSTAVLFLLSALFEITSVNSSVPLFGAIRSGLFAESYHLVYFVIFLTLGIGLWKRKYWGYIAVFVATLIYTADKVTFLLNQPFIEKMISAQLAGYETLLPPLDKGFILQILTLTFSLVVICWWAFALYTYKHRKYFYK